MNFPLKKSIFLPGLLTLFFGYGALMLFLFPIFQGPDEAVHFGTIQHRAEPADKNWTITVLNNKKNILGDISSMQLPEETIQSAEFTQFDEIRLQSENNQIFSATEKGPAEIHIAENSWKSYLDVYPASTSGTRSLYYDAGAWIEAHLSESSLFVRFWSHRVLSLFLSIGVIIFAYLTFRKIGFSNGESTLVTTLVAFQPMFVMIGTNVNIDILLILSFSVFVYASVSLLQDGLNKWSFALLFGSMILGFYAKGPGIVLVPVFLTLLAALLYQRFQPTKKQLGLSLLVGALLVGLALSTFASSYVANITNSGATSHFSSPLVSLTEYAQKTLDIGGARSTHDSYWGHFGWLDTKISEAVLSIIWVTEIAGLIGLALYLLTKQIPFYLPQKRYIVFSLGIILALQLAIRFYDWRVFDANGQILIGQPGRYFLPNIIPHMLLLVTGLGYLFTKNERQFYILLKTLAVLMILLSIYSLINVIIPRYYL